MAFKILTKNGIENTNIDGARSYNFNSGRRSGIVQGALNECNFFANASNSYAIDTGELRLCGHRVVITETEYRTMQNTPSTDIRYSVIAQVIVDTSYNVSFQFLLQNASAPLTQDNLDENGTGTYQLEIGRFTYTTDGVIEDIVRTADLITGGIGGGQSTVTINIGNVETEKISPNLDAEVDVDTRYSEEEEKEYIDFKFSLPIDMTDTINTANTAITNSQNAVSTANETKSFAEHLADTPDISEAGNIGTPSVSFIDNVVGDVTYKKFKFSNLKGEKGDKGDKGDTGEQGIQGQTGAIGNGISSISKTGTNGLTDTYTITFTDSTTTTFEVENGKGIVSIAKTSISGLVDTYTITYNDDSTSTFTITNGDSIELRVSDGYFQWKYTNSQTWNNLISVASLSNADTEFSTTSTNAIANSTVTNALNNITSNTTLITNSMGGFNAGLNSQASSGGAVGNGTFATKGGAVGDSAYCGDGFAGGYNAKTTSTLGFTIDAIQLGTGTNSTPKSLQVYNDNIYNAETHTLTVQNIESDALTNKLNVSDYNTIGDWTELFIGSNQKGGTTITLSESMENFNFILFGIRQTDKNNGIASAMLPSTYFKWITNDTYNRVIISTDAQYFGVRSNGWNQIYIENVCSSSNYFSVYGVGRKK